ncbi:hypothetical protein [Roseimaritima ulvae]|uniref:hypothetical protein n=1 Tax=Roseimaritima ulvae TaxID=980254 RepID=UPI0008321135|nr:hypothetical protein [Roseimaritima ulvae]
MDGFAKTPRYVLRDGSHPTSPLISQSSSDAQATVIFGFADKPEYDIFLRSSGLALTPYPLVKGYLQNPIALDNGASKLVVLDAASSQQRLLLAATFESVLEAFHLNSEAVAVSHRLVLEKSSSAYRIQRLVNAAFDVTKDQV